MEYFKEFGQLKELTRWAAAIAINRVLVYENGQIKITFNFEADLNQIQELLEATRQREEII